jgi:hypothetical protein
MQDPVVHPGDTGNILDGGFLEGFFLQAGVKGLEDL